MSKYLTPSRHYVPVPNTIITDTDLSPFAKMVACLLAYLLGIPDFVVTIGALRKYTGKGTATISAALSELRERGYLRRYRSCRWGKWTWAYVLFSESQNDGLSNIQQVRELPPSRYVTPQSGFTKVSGNFIRRNDIHPTSKMVYLYMAAHAGKPGFILHPWSIANELDYNEQTIQKHIQKLRKLGYIDAAQTRNANGRMGAMDYIVYAAPTAHRSTGDAFAGDVSTVDASGRGFNNNLTNNNLSKEDTESNQPLQELTNCPLEIADACDWIPNRYFNAAKQHIYDVVISCIGKLYVGNNDARKFICEHLSPEDMTLCEIADRTTETCIERILHPKKDAVVITNRGGYINEVCKDYILHWNEKRQELEFV